MLPKAKDAAQHSSMAQNAQEQLERANVKLEVLRAQIKQLESSDDVAATIQQQATETLESAKDQVDKAEKRPHEANSRACAEEERARVAESQRNDVLKTLAHLNSALDKTKSAHTDSERRVQQLTEDLEMSNNKIELLKKQLKTAQDETGELGKKELERMKEKAEDDRSLDGILTRAEEFVVHVDNLEKAIKERDERIAGLDAALGGYSLGDDYEINDENLMDDDWVGMRL
jgi:chromosome segregation ATPase